MFKICFLLPAMTCEVGCIKHTPKGRFLLKMSVFCKVGRNQTSEVWRGSFQSESLQKGLPKSFQEPISCWRYVISASHNPVHENGIKFFIGKGAEIRRKPVPRSAITACHNPAGYEGFKFNWRKGSKILLYLSAWSWLKPAIFLIKMPFLHFLMLKTAETNAFGAYFVQPYTMIFATMLMWSEFDIHDFGNRGTVASVVYLQEIDHNAAIWITVLAGTLLEPGEVAMIYFYPLKPFERIWDRIEKSRLPKWLKALLLTLVTITMLVNSFGFLWLAKQVVDLFNALLNHFPPWDVQTDL